MRAPPAIKPWLRISLLCALTLVCAALLVRLQLRLDLWIGRETPYLLLALNALPVLLLYLLACGIFRRPILAAWLITGLLLSLFAINQLKVEQLAEPVIFSDFLLTPQLINSPELFAHYTRPGWLAALLVFWLVAAALLWWLEWIRFRLWESLALMLIGAIGLVMLASPSLPPGRLYHGEEMVMRPWQTLENARKYGLAATLAADSSRTMLSRPQPDPAILEEVDRRFGSNQTETSEPEQLPDIILLLSESFFDPGILQHTDSCQALPDFCDLRQSGLSASITVPTLGGNTTRTEFEVLTGVPYARLESSDYPYVSVVTRPMAALPNLLVSKGYRAVAIHPHHRTFWQRQRALPLLGFDTFLAEEDFKDRRRSGYYLSDQVMTDLVALQLDVEPETPAFIFAISMENHGPWGSRPNLDESWKSLPVPEALPPELHAPWRQYLYHARQSSAALKRLSDIIAKRQRPTLLVFFGDHLPGLHGVFQSLGFDNGETAYRQKTPVLALANFDLPEPGWKPEAAWQLAPWILALADIQTPHPLVTLGRIQSSRVDGSRQEEFERTLQLQLLNMAASSRPPDLSD